MRWLSRRRHTEPEAASVRSREPAPYSAKDRETIDAFHVLWYERRQRQTWRETSWMGVPSQQCPFDLWVYQEVIEETRPDSIIEVGIKRGGTTLYFAHVLDALYRGSTAEVVVGVDITVRVDASVSGHPRVRLVEGSSIDPKTVARVRELAGSRPLVLLDSDHTAQHVERELDLYADLVPPGGYVIVNDTNINGHPVLVGKGDGPYEAVESFLGRRADFTADPWCEKHMLTQSPRGFLRRSEAAR